MRQPAATPDAESQRLARLRELMVLDTDSEPLFEHLVRWASETCSTPIALVSLIDEGRQWFKAQIGLPGVSQTPREQAFCAHAILDDDVFEVHDASTDARFRDNPLVTGDPQIRFYAGAPLTLPGGERIGTLCVIDRQPRRLMPEQAMTLHNLARAATEALLMRRDLILRTLAARSDYEQALIASEYQHRSIVEEQSELISLARPDGQLVYANPAYARQVQQPQAALVGRSLYDFVDPSDRAMVRDRIEWVMSNGEALVGENRLQGADGRELWVAWTNDVQLQPDGQRWLRSVGRDVTARHHAERALHFSQAFLARTGRVAGVGGWQLELATRHLSWSDETRRIHEVPQAFQPTLDNAIHFYAPEARARIEAALQEAMRGGQGWDLELPMVTAKGRPIWVRAVSEVEFEDGLAVRLVGAVQDITGRKALEQRIAQSERFVRAVTDSLDVHIAYVDRELRHRFVNLAYCQRFGLTREQMLGRTRAELLGRADEPEVTARVAAVLRGDPQHFEHEKVVDGKRLRIESRLRPDIDASGQVMGYFATGIDVTERSRNEEALRVLTTIIEKSTDYVLQSGPRGELLYMNPAARRVVGMAPDEPLHGRLATEFNTPDTNQLLVDELLPAVRRDGLWRGETVVQAADGRRLPVSHLVVAHHDADGRLLRYASVLRDISHEVQQRQELLRQSATLRSVTDALPVIVSAVDAQLRYRFVNNAFEQWHGLQREHVLGQLATAVMVSTDVERSRYWAQRALAGESVHFERHYPERTGQPTLSLSYIPLRLADGTTDGFVGVAFDITPHRQEQVRLQSLAERDALTGLLNRAGFQTTLARELQVGRGPELALLYIDLDRFKPVNDNYGHATGDALLQVFAQRLQRLVRPTDAIARLGGDEFAVLLVGVRELAAAEAVAAKVVDAAGEVFVVGAMQLNIGASVGVALGVAGIDRRTDGDNHGDTGGNTDGAELLQRADAQLYRAKQAGRGRLASEHSAKHLS
jgi:diguanylate cyclase (GGDEF)-like protein/PAS domain S-box-containing protein